MIGKQFAHFCLAGVGGFLADAGLVYLLLQFSTPFYVARLISFLAAVFVTWLINRRVTFEASESATFSEFARYLAAMSVGGVFNYFISLTVVTTLAGSNYIPLIAVGVGSLSGLAINFGLARFWVFRRRKGVADGRVAAADGTGLTTWPNLSSPQGRINTALVLVFLVGVAHLLLLPPFEGYDELAHWSSIEEIAATGSPPKDRIDPISADLQNYIGPYPYNKALQALVHRTAKDFRRDRQQSLGLGPQGFVRPSPDDWENKVPNWEAQHPPLFYYLMVPIFRLTSHLGWKLNFVALRLVSWIIAVAGLTIAAHTRYPSSDSKISIGLAVALWPFIVPEFFPEMARLGNDSLCLLFASCLWAVLVGMPDRAESWRKPITIGVLLGLGLLTKAFFLPIGLSVVLIVGLFPSNEILRRRLSRVAVIVLIAAAVAGWWYFEKLQSTGTFGGGNELSRVQSLGFAHALYLNFSVVPFLKNLLGIGLTFTWAGTWSFVVPRAAFMLPVFFFLLVPIMRWLKNLDRRSRLELYPAMLVLPMLGGLVYHELASIALGATGSGTPGWYFHILAGPIAFAWAIGWRGDWLDRSLACLTAIYTAVLWSIQLSVFSGCAAPDDGGHLSWVGSDCFLDSGQLLIVGSPVPAIAALATALLLASILLFRHRVVGNKVLPAS